MPESSNPEFDMLSQPPGEDAESKKIIDPKTHAFDLPEFREYFDAEFPAYAEALDEANRPIVSEQPDELETWEAEQITARKTWRPSESPAMYLRRLLYEETFSVNQNPGLTGPSFSGSAGLTPGGLISHFYQEGSYSGLTMADIATRPELDEETLGQALMRLGPERRSGASDLFAVVGYMTNPDRFGRFINPDLVGRYARGEIQPPAECDTIGYRLLRMLHVTTEMLEPVADKDLQARFVNHAHELPRAELIIRAWHRSQALVPDGSFTTTTNPEINAALDNLLTLRTHPEAQVFYEYLSPSGYINSTISTPGSISLI